MRSSINYKSSDQFSHLQFIAIPFVTLFYDNYSFSENHHSFIQRTISMDIRSSYFRCDSLSYFSLFCHHTCFFSPKQHLRIFLTSARVSRSGVIIWKPIYSFNNHHIWRKGNYDPSWVTLLQESSPPREAKNDF